MGILIREADLDRELPAIAETVNGAFRMQISPERFRWLYLDNPDGRAVAWFAVDDQTGAVAGCTAVSPRRVRVAGRDVLAWNCGDFSIATRYRTMGAAIKLRRAAREGIDAGQSAFLYAHPNDRMLEVHLRVGHSPLAQMRRYAKPLRLRTSNRVAKRLGSPLLRVWGTELLIRRSHDVELIAEGQPLPRDIGAVYDAVKDSIGTAVVRDYAYLSWRFQAYPERQMCTVITRSRGRPSGYLTFAVEDGVATVKDWLAVDANARDQVLTAFLREARRRQLASASVIALETHRDIPALRRLGFMLRSERSTAVTYAGENEPVKRDVGNAALWYMTSGDRDV